MYVAFLTSQNLNHSPGGGSARILDRKTTYDAVSKVGSKDRLDYVPGGGSTKIYNQKAAVSSAKSKVGSTDNIAHKAGGGMCIFYHNDRHKQDL
jgi:hypothetical protein